MWFAKVKVDFGGGKLEAGLEGAVYKLYILYIDDAFDCNDDEDEDRDDDQSYIDNTEMILIKTKTITTFAPERIFSSDFFLRIFLLRIFSGG